MSTSTTILLLCLIGVVAVDASSIHVNLGRHASNANPTSTSTATATALTMHVTTTATSIPMMHNYQSNNESKMTKLKRKLRIHGTNQRILRMRNKTNLHRGIGIGIGNDNKNQGKCRTRFMFKLPSTSQELHQIMFANLYKSKNYKRKNINTNANANANTLKHFNHHHVGITRPIIRQIHLQVHGNDETNDKIHVNNLPRTQKQHQHQQNEEWWPQSQSQSQSQSIDNHNHSNNNNNINDGSNIQRGPWRIKTYRKRIGYGQQCYNQVRDAALDWEFKYHNNDNDNNNNNNDDNPILGILRATPPPSTKAFQENTNPNILQICNSPSPFMQHKKIVTFTQFAPPLLISNILHHTKKLINNNINFNFNLPLALPSIYVLNPVAVIYDIVDQISHGAGGDNTFTSTAYCTLKGHLLSGEERVSVILRHGDTSHEAYRHPNGDGECNSNGRGNSNGNGNGNGGCVDVEILSYSRPAPTLLGKLVWPFIGSKQDEFFRRELEALENVAIGIGASSSEGGGRVRRKGD